VGAFDNNTDTSGTTSIRYTGDPYRGQMVSTAARDYGRARSFADLIAGGIGYGAARDYGKKVGPTPASMTSRDNGTGGGGTRVGSGSSTPWIKPNQGGSSGTSGTSGSGSSGGGGGRVGVGGPGPGTGEGSGREGGSREQSYSTMPNEPFEKQLSGIRLSPDDNKYDITSSARMRPSDSSYYGAENLTDSLPDPEQDDEPFGSRINKAWGGAYRPGK